MSAILDIFLFNISKRPTCFSYAKNPLTGSYQYCIQLVAHTDYDSKQIPITFQIFPEAILNPSISTFICHRAD